MTVRFFQSFSQHQKIGPFRPIGSPGFGNDNVMGYWDHNRYWNYSSLGFEYDYIDNPMYSGRAIRLGANGAPYGHAGLTSAASLSELVGSTGINRVGFKFVADWPSTPREIFSIGRSGLISPFREIVLVGNSSGQLMVYHTNNTSYGGWQDGTLIGVLSYSNISPNTVEILINLPAGTAQIQVNGSVLNGTFPPIAGPSTNLISFNQPGVFVNDGILVDFWDFWLTRGETLVDGLNSVQVCAIFDGYETFTGAGLRGTLLFGENRYETPWTYSSATSLINPDVLGFLNGKNIGNDIHFIFQRNPNTGQPWSANDLSFFWGVCYSGDGSKIRLMGLRLEELWVVNGVPEIRVKKAGATAYFSGPWEKTNDTLSLSSHVNSIPRPSGVNRDDVPSLYINGPGCLLFQESSEQSDLFGQVGLTFAEKNQVNHRDWTSVDGVGQEAKSYFISGYGVYGEGNKKFQSNYVTVNYETTPTGQAHIQGVWEYSIDPDTGRWSMRQNVYGPEASTEYKHATRKLKIRGHGKALQLRVSSVGDAPFIINGWSTFVTSNQAV